MTGTGMPSEARGLRLLRDIGPILAKPYGPEHTIEDKVEEVLIALDGTWITPFHPADTPSVCRDLVTKVLEGDTSTSR